MLRRCQVHFSLSLLVLSVVTLPLVGASGPAPPPERHLPEFRVKLTDGTMLKSKDLIGKVTVIDFWGTWCPPCLEEIPRFNAFYGEYRDKGVGFYGLAADSGTGEELRKASTRLKIQYPVAALSYAELDAFGDISVFPTTWIINRRGFIEKELMGSSPGKQKLLRETVNRLLKESPK